MDTMTVKATGEQKEDGGWPNGFWERHPDHPKSDAYPEGGEVHVVGPDTHTVAKTTGIIQAIRAGTIVEATKKGEPKETRDAAGNILTPPTPPAAKGTPLMTT